MEFHLISFKNSKGKETGEELVFVTEICKEAILFLKISNGTKFPN